MEIPYALIDPSVEVSDTDKMIKLVCKGSDLRWRLDTYTVTDIRVVKFHFKKEKHYALFLQVLQTQFSSVLFCYTSREGELINQSDKNYGLFDTKTDFNRHQVCSKKFDLI